ncbi:hypothetical protein DAMA08_038590 [Martiniozyma asiatica (nom. inval.)]|nr:hypothetical protein DAMA08_038590 [Martiniozyma asiatica]
MSKEATKSYKKNSQIIAKQKLHNIHNILQTEIESFPANSRLSRLPHAILSDIPVDEKYWNDSASTYNFKTQQQNANKWFKTMPEMRNQRRNFNFVNPNAVYVNPFELNQQQPANKYDGNRIKKIYHDLQNLHHPNHKIDKFKNYLLETLEPPDPQKDSKWKKLVRFLLNNPLKIARFIWHYLLLQIHIFYNLWLFFSLFWSTPPLEFFCIGFALFWTKIIYEIYRDIMHKDDIFHQSNIPKEISIAAAISAGLGVIMRMKALNGEITESYWHQSWISQNSTVDIHTA